MSLKFRKKPCHISGSINARTERHGEEPVPAMDIGVELLITATELNKLIGDPHTVDAWFTTSGDQLPEPFLKNIKPYKLKGKYEDCSALFILGVTSIEVPIKNAKCSNLSFEPQIGGLTKLKLKIQTLITNKTNELFLWMDRDVEVELQFGELIDASEQKDLDLGIDDDKPLNTHGEGEEPAEGKKRSRRKTSDGNTLNA